MKPTHFDPSFSGSGKLHPRDGDDIPGKGLIQGVSAVFAFHALLSDERVRIWDRSLNREVCPIEVLPTLRSLHAILSYKGDDMTAASQAFVAKLKDSSAQDPARRLRTANLYQAQLTQLPGEEDWLDLEDSEEITIEPVTAETRSRTTSVQDDGPRTPGLGSM